MRLLLILFFIGCATTQTKPKTLEELCKEDPKAAACQYLKDYVPRKEFERTLAQVPKMNHLGSSRISKCDCKKFEKENNDLRAVLRQERKDYEINCGEVLK